MTRRRLFAALMGLPLASRLNPVPIGSLGLSNMDAHKSITMCIGDEAWIRDKVVAAVMQAIEGNERGAFTKFQSLVD